MTALNTLETLLTEIIRASGGDDNGVKVMRDLLLRGRLMGVPLNGVRPINEQTAALVIEKAKEILLRDASSPARVSVFG